MGERKVSQAQVMDNVSGGFSREGAHNPVNQLLFESNHYFNPLLIIFSRCLAHTRLVKPCGFFGWYFAGIAAERRQKRPESVSVTLRR